MAGVSLGLRRMLGSRSVLSQAAGYAYAGIAMAGPWILTSTYMLLLRVLETPGVEFDARRDFQSTVLYSYCGSTLLMGFIQLVVARHVSDLLYVGDTRGVTPAFSSSALVSLLLHVVAACASVLVLRPPLSVAAAQVAFFGSLGLVWNGMIFLGAVRRFMLIVGVFVGGMALSLGASLLLAVPFGMAGLLGGLAAGHALIAAFFAARIRAEFPSERPFDFGFIRTLGKYPSLLVIGFAYAAGLWIDKMILWAGPYTERSEGGLSTFPIYDNAVFLAYLTTIPSLALLFIRIEVSFFEKCRAFYRAVRMGADLDSIRRHRQGVVESFKETVLRLAVSQAPVTLLVVILAPLFLDLLGINWVQYYVFRIACVGAFLQILVLAVLLASLHLALYRLAMGISLLYLAVATGVTLAGSAAGFEYYGFGYAAAGLVTVAVGYPLVLRRLRVLDRETFLSQPY